MSKRIIRSKKCPYCNKEFFSAPSCGLKNWLKRKYCSKQCKDKVPHPKGDSAYAWKHNVTYAGIHKWLYRELGKPNRCDFFPEHTSKKFEWANISKKYKRDLNDWIRLCAKCHDAYDEPWLKRERDSLGRFI